MKKSPIIVAEKKKFASRWYAANVAHYIADIIRAGGTLISVEGDGGGHGLKYTVTYEAFEEIEHTGEILC